MITSQSQTTLPSVPLNPYSLIAEAAGGIFDHGYGRFGVDAVAKPNHIQTATHAPLNDSRQRDGNPSSRIRNSFQVSESPDAGDSGCTMCDRAPACTDVVERTHVLIDDRIHPVESSREHLRMNPDQRRLHAVANDTLPAQLTFQGDLVADMVVGCPFFCGAKGACKLKNGEPKCVCDCGWSGFGCNVAEGFCPLPVSYMLPGNTSNVPAAGACRQAHLPCSSSRLLSPPARPLLCSA